MVRSRRQKDLALPDVSLCLSSFLKLVLLTNVYGCEYDGALCTLVVHHVEIIKTTPFVIAKRHKLLIQGTNPIELGPFYHQIAPPKRDSETKYLVVFNPVGGDRIAFSSLYRLVVEPMFEAAGIAHDLVATEYQHHALLLGSQFDQVLYQAVVVIGGDGLLHEFINGLLGRRDWRSAKEIPIGIIPGGTSNAVARSLGITDPIYATFSIIRGITKPHDAMLFEQDGHRFYGHLVLMWGLVADSDLGGDACRWLGRHRLVCSVLQHTLRFRSYHAVIEYLEGDSKVEGRSTDDVEDRPPARFKYLFDDDGNSGEIKRIPEGAYHSFVGIKYPWLDRDVIVSNKMIPETDVIDLFTIPKQRGITRWTLLKMIFGGNMAALHDDSSRCWHGKVRACRVSFREYEGVILDVDGECAPPQNIYFESIPQILSFFVPE